MFRFPAFTTGPLRRTRRAPYATRRKLRYEANQVWMNTIFISQGPQSSGKVAVETWRVKTELIITILHIIIFIQQARHGTKEFSKRMPALARCSVDVRECRVTLHAHHTALFSGKDDRGESPTLLQHLTLRPKYTYNYINLKPRLQNICAKNIGAHKMHK